MELSTVQYLSDQQGHTTGVMIPISLWQNIQSKLEFDTKYPQTTAWDILDNLVGSITAPPDWAAEHDHYLYGTEKRELDITL